MMYLDTHAHMHKDTHMCAHTHTHTGCGCEAENTDDRFFPPFLSALRKAEQQTHFHSVAVTWLQENGKSLCEAAAAARAHSSLLLSSSHLLSFFI